MRKYIMAVLLCFVLLFNMLLPVSVSADEWDNGQYEVVIEDDAELLSDSQELMLTEIMDRLSVYGNVAFKSIETNYQSTGSYAAQYYLETFGDTSGTVFLIDMDNRYIWIYSNGAFYDVVTKSYADVITDNVYKYASAKDYFLCAYYAYEQELTLLEGQSISQPMKYISNVLLAIALGMVLNYIIVRIVSRKRKASDAELIEGIERYCLFDYKGLQYTNSTRVYSPRSSGSGGGGGSRGGGGGSHGGGGGHRF